MRLFFNSIRYSEDMDIDINTMSINALRDTVINIVGSVAFLNELRSYGIEQIQMQAMAKAKQTQTTQRFKIHLFTQQSEDLFTKIEFSRRQPSDIAISKSVSEKIMRQYKMTPLIVSHYDAMSAIKQKITALANRKVVQARDTFDLYMLSTQYSPELGKIETDAATATAACDNLYSVSFQQFHDSVVNYLAEEDKTAYNTPEIWDEIRLKVHELICPKT